MRELVVMCGLPGSGKSTYAHRYKRNHHIFSIVDYGAILDTLDMGHSVIVDACNIIQAHRLSLLRLVQTRSSITKRLVFMCVAPDVCIERTIAKNNGRDSWDWPGLSLLASQAIRKVDKEPWDHVEWVPKRIENIFDGFGVF